MMEAQSTHLYIWLASLRPTAAPAASHCRCHTWSHSPADVRTQSHPRDAQTLGHSDAQTLGRTDTLSTREMPRPPARSVSSLQTTGLCTDSNPSSRSWSGCRAGGDRTVVPGGGVTAYKCAGRALLGGTVPCRTVPRQAEPSRAVP